MDITVIKKAIYGDPSAFEALYQHTHNKGFSVAYSVLHDSYEAEDVLQDSYIKMYEKIDSLQNPALFENWFYTIVKNRALDHLRSTKKISSPDLFSTFESDENPDFIFVDTLASHYREFNPEANVDYTETKEIITNIINGLPEMQRACIILRFKGDMKISEIADRLNIPQSTVKSNLNYGKKKIETEVQALEKQGVRLYSVTPILIIPFLRWMCGNNVPARLTAEAVAMANTTAFAGTSDVFGSSNSYEAAGSVSSAGSTAISGTNVNANSVKQSAYIGNSRSYASTNSHDVTDSFRKANSPTNSEASINSSLTEKAATTKTAHSSDNMSTISNTSADKVSQTAKATKSVKSAHGTAEKAAHITTKAVADSSIVTTTGAVAKVGGTTLATKIIAGIAAVAATALLGCVAVKAIGTIPKENVANTVNAVSDLAQAIQTNPNQSDAYPDSPLADEVVLTEDFLKGTWTIDSAINSYNELRLRQVFGSAVNLFTPNMNFGDNGEFSYWISVYGGEGSYQIVDGQITFTVTDQNSDYQESSTIQLEVIDSVPCLIQQFDFITGPYYVVWSRENADNSNGQNSPEKSALPVTDEIALTDDFLKGTWYFDILTDSYNEIPAETFFDTIGRHFNPYMIFGNNSEFLYGIGADCGIGTYQIVDEQITYTVTIHNGSLPESSTIRLEIVDGSPRLVQTFSGFMPTEDGTLEDYYLVWSRDNVYNSYGYISIAPIAPNGTSVLPIDDESVSTNTYNSELITWNPAVDSISKLVGTKNVMIGNKEYQLPVFLIDSDDARALNQEMENLFTWIEEPFAHSCAVYGKFLTIAYFGDRYDNGELIVDDMIHTTGAMLYCIDITTGKRVTLENVNENYSQDVKQCMYDKLYEDFLPYDTEEETESMVEFYMGSQINILPYGSEFAVHHAVLHANKCYCLDLVSPYADQVLDVKIDTELAKTVSEYFPVF